jgi:Uma2 family endonuclease
MNESATAPAAKSNNINNLQSNSSNSKPTAGIGRWQNLIATNAAIAIGSRLSGAKTEIYVNGMCVQLSGKMTSFPSVVVVSGEPKFADADSELLTNPTIVIDIAACDSDPLGRVQKLESYLAIASIKECLLVRSDEMRVEHYARQQTKQWLYRIYDERDDVISLDSLNCKLSVSEIYSQIKVRAVELSSKAVN